jgi:hypothetical protein
MKRIVKLLRIYVPAEPGPRRASFLLVVRGQRISTLRNGPVGTLADFNLVATMNGFGGNAVIGLWPIAGRGGTCATIVSPRHLAAMADFSLGIE